MWFWKSKKYFLAILFLLFTGTLSIYILVNRPDLIGYVKLFYYTIISNLYISIFPHEPVLLYYGIIYPILPVSMVAAMGSTTAGFIDYETISPLLHHRKVRKFYADKRLYTKSVHYFSVYPFWTIVVAALTPIPFYPFKFLSIASSYNEKRYLIALFLGRFFRHVYLASIGSILNVPDWILLVLFLMMFLIGAVQVVQKNIKIKRIKPVHLE